MVRTLSACVAAALTVTGALAQDQPPVFRSAVNLITIPVRVLDAEGRAVQGLAASDFSVRIDGEPRTVASAAPVRTAPAREPRPAALSYSTNTGTAPSGIRRIVLLVIDTGAFDTAAARRVAAEAEKLVDALPPGDLAGFTTIPSASNAIEPTTDREPVRAALRKVSGGIEPRSTKFDISPGEAIQIEQGDERVFEEVGRRECMFEGKGGGPACLRYLRHDALLLARFTHDAAGRRLRSLASIVEALPATPDLKHIVLMTPGLFEEAGSFGRYRELGADLASKTAALSIIQVEGSEGSAESRLLAGGPDWQMMSTALYQLAGVSGADLFRHGTLSTRVERFSRELDAYYVLAVSAERTDLDGKRHAITVAVHARGLTLQHAPTFARTADTPKPPARDRDLASVMRATGLEGDVPLAVQTTTVRGEAPDRLQVIAIVRVEHANPRDIRIGLEVRDGARVVDAKQGQVEPDGTFVSSLLLPPGRYGLRVGVVDREGRAGSVDHPFAADLPAAGRLRTSGLIVWPAGGAARPSFEFSSGQSLSAALELYPLDATATQDAKVRFTLASLADPSVSRAFGETARQSDGGIERAVASLDLSGLPAGEYVVRAEIHTGSRATVAEQHVRLHADTPPASPAATGAAAPAAIVPDLPLLVARASAYVGRYFDELTNVVMDEKYQQQLRSPPDDVARYTGRVEIRTLQSELLLVTLPQPAGPTAFRDVLAVDGRTLRNRDDRLQRLFMGEQGSAVQQAREIMRESSRYNLGAVRTVNAPTVPLIFVRQDHARRLRWTARGEQVVAGQKLQRFRFQEVQSPTVIRTPDGNEVFTHGEVWVHPEDGAIWRADMAFVVRERSGRGRTPNFEGEVSTAFQRHEAWGLLVPQTMRERYSLAGGQESTGHAEYSNYRRFQVKTTEEIPLPEPKRP